MSQLRIAFIAALALVACDKDKAPAPADNPPSAPAAKPAEKAADKVPEKAPAPVKTVDAPKVSKTSALDLELVEQSGKYTLRDDAYEVTFPAKPEVTGGVEPAPNGMNLRTATAMAQASDTEAFAFFMIPIPKGVPYDVKVGLDGARDGAIRNVNGTLISEVEATVGGLKGRKIIASAEFGGQKIYLQMHLTFDKGHNTMIGMFTTGSTKNLPEDFANTFKINPKGKAPPSK